MVPSSTGFGNGVSCRPRPLTPPANRQSPPRALAVAATVRRPRADAGQREPRIPAAAMAAMQYRLRRDPALTAASEPRQAVAHDAPLLKCGRCVAVLMVSAAERRIDHDGEPDGDRQRRPQERAAGPRLGVGQERDTEGGTDRRRPASRGARQASRTSPSRRWRAATTDRWSGSSRRPRRRRGRRRPPRRAARSRSRRLLGFIFLLPSKL